MKPTFDFGEFRLNTAERSLKSSGHPVALAPKALDVLIVLVENHGRIVERNDLMRKVWPDTFVEDNNLAFNISVLRKLFGESGTSPRYIETVPKRGYRFVAEVREAVSMAPGPAPEQPGTIDPPDESPADKSTAVKTKPRALPRLVLRWAAAMLVVTASVLATAHFIAPADALDSLAVLPFRALDTASTDESLEVGLTDALITRLSRSLSIPVRPVAAVLRYRDRPDDPLASGRALKVDAVLEGTFQKHDGMIRSSVRLLRSRDGKVLYAGVFDQQVSELFRLEDALSTELAGALILKLAASKTGPGMPAQRNPTAYAAYLKGRYWWSQRTRESIHHAIDYFHEAIAADPTDALAYAGLADAYLLLPGVERIPASTMMPLARAAAERAIQIDPDLAEAHASLGLLAENYDLDWAAAEREFSTAIRLNPNYPTGRHWYAEYIGTMGRIGESEAQFERARNLDPLSAAIPADEAKIFWFNHRFEKSAAFARQSLALDPHFMYAHLMLGASLMESGDCSGAMAEVGPSGPVDDSDLVLATRAYVEDRCGLHAGALAVVDRMMAPGRTASAPFMLAIAYAGVGDSARAEQWAERAVAEREGGIASLRCNLAFDRMRGLAPFQELLKRVRLN